MDVLNTAQPTTSRDHSAVKDKSHDTLATVNTEDNLTFGGYMLKPSNVKQIWSGFKVNKNMFEYMQWYFRPRNSYEPERVDYNALAILAEYQTYNLEFLKNDLDLTNDQAANILEAFWTLLEFDPDEKSVEKDVA